MKRSLLRSVGILIIAALIIISCSPSGGQTSGTNTATKIIGKWQIDNRLEANSVYWIEFTEDGTVRFGNSKPSLGYDGRLDTVEYNGTYSVTGDIIDIQFTDDDGLYSGEHTINPYYSGLLWETGPISNLGQIGGPMEKVEEFQFVRQYQAEDGFKYTVSGEEASIDGYEGTATDLVIPEMLSFSVDGTEINASITRINSIKDANGNSSAISVTIPASVIKIGDNAFAYTNISSVTFPDTDMIILGEKVFAGCQNLKSFTFPKCISSIPEGTFYSSGLESIVIPSTVTDTDGGSDYSGVFAKCKSLKSIDLSEAGFDFIPSYFLAECTALMEIKLQKNLRIIENNAFDGCAAITSIVLPETLESIDSYAFLDTGITEITIPSSVKDIKDGFRANKNLRSITINAELTYLADEAFSYCTSLETITLPPTLEKINSGAFRGCSALKELTIPEGVTYLGLAFLLDCNSLPSVTIPASVTDVDPGAFLRYNGEIKFAEGSSFSFVDGSLYKDYGKTLAIWNEDITDVVIPEGVEKIEEVVFEYFDFTSLTLPSTLKEIAAFAFRYSVIEAITVPEGVTTIGDDAFYGIDELKTLSLPSTLTHVDDSILINCDNLETITFNGTTEEWEAFNIDLSSSPNVVVTCLKDAEA